LIAVAGIVAITLINNGDADSGVGDVISRDVAAAENGVTEAPGDDVATPGPVSPGGEGQGAYITGAAVAASVIYVDVYGAVAAPSVCELAPGSRVQDAIEAAGGLTGNADIRYINRAAVLNDGDRVYIPTVAETESGEPLPASAGLIGAAAQGAAGTVNAAGEGQGAGSSDAALVNINTADSSALQTLSGVGPVTAQKIIDYRESNGPFGNIEDIKAVSGIGEKTFDKLKDHICV
jgi:competence protein ComEA